MAIKYLAGDRLQGTSTERAAMTTGGPTVQDDMTDSSLWTFAHGSITGTPPALHLPGPGLFPPTSNPARKASRLITLTGTSGKNYDEMVIDIDYKHTNGTTDMIWAGVSSFMTEGNGSANPFSGVSITNNHHTVVIGYSNTGASHKWRGKDGTSTDQVQSFGGSPVPATAILYYRIVIDIPDITVYRFVSDANRTAYNYSASTGTIDTSDTMELTSARVTIYRANPKWSHFYTGLYATGSANTYLYGFKIWENTTVPIALSYPNLPNGAIFEESDTGKHYMFNGTSAWNEIT